LNALLAQPLPQTVKMDLCTCVEDLLHGVDAYSGFNYLHWMKEGYEAWEAAGRPDGSTKLDYIIGPTPPTDLATHGEYSRYYYLSRLMGN
jgi:hypothetical protein